MKYYPKINGLRFVAIFFVLLEHYARFIGSHIEAGFYGVDLFFVISGFLVTNILLHLNKNSFKENYYHFLGRRTLRIFPIYYLTILVLWLFGLNSVVQNTGSLLTYTFNYAMVRKNLPITIPMGHFWSLSVEEQFYLFWPFLILLLRKNWRLLMFIIILLIIIGYAQFCFSIIPSISEYNYVSLLTRMGSLGLGALGGTLAMKNLLPNRLLQSKLFEVFVYLILIISLLVEYKIQFLILGICSLYLVLKASFFEFSFQPVNKFLTNKFVIYIGTISYGIYIFHLPIAYYCDKLFFNSFWLSIPFESFGKFKILQWHPWLLKFPLYSSLSILTATLSFKYIEKPILNLKDKYFRY